MLKSHNAALLCNQNPKTLSIKDLTAKYRFYSFYIAKNEKKYFPLQTKALSLQPILKRELKL